MISTHVTFLYKPVSSNVPTIIPLKRFEEQTAVTNNNTLEQEDGSIVVLGTT